MNVTVIINGSRKLSSVAKLALKLLNAVPELDVLQIYTEGPKHATFLAIQHAEKTDCIVAIGGDGTCNEVVQGIVGSGADVRFGLIPNGTGNDFLRMLDTFDPTTFVQNVRDNRSSFIDIGKVTLDGNVRYFANIADVGFGAKVVELMNAQRKVPLSGKLSYSLAIIRAFFAYKKQRVRLIGDDFEYEGKVLLVAFCNGSTFGHGLTIHPDARLNNGKICIAVIGDVSLFTYFRKLKDLKRGRKIQHREAFYFESKSIKVNKMGAQMEMEGDGELFGQGIQEVEILPERICLISSI